MFTKTMSVVVSLAFVAGSVQAAPVLNNPDYTLREFATLDSNRANDIVELDGVVYATVASSNGFATIDASGVSTFISYPSLSLTPTGLAAHNGLLYFGTRDGRVFSWDPNTVSQEPTLIADGLPDDVFSVVVAPDDFGSHGGKLLVGGREQIWVVDPADGSRTTLHEFDAGRSTVSLDIYPDGRLLAVHRSPSVRSIYDVSPDGTASVFGEASGSSLYALAAHPTTGEVFTIAQLADSIRRIGPDGVQIEIFVRDVHTFTGSTGKGALAFSEDGSSLYFGGEGVIYAIDGFPAVPSSNGTIATPEPATLSLMLLGLAALVVGPTFRKPGKPAA